MYPEIDSPVRFRSNANKAHLTKARDLVELLIIRINYAKLGLESKPIKRQIFRNRFGQGSQTLGACVGNKL